MMGSSRNSILGLLLVTCGVLPAWAQSPASPDQSAEACPGTRANVRERCGCDPRDEATFNALKQTGISDTNLRSQVRYCFSLDGNADVSLKKKLIDVDATAGLKGCLKKVENQFPEYRTSLAKLVDHAQVVDKVKVDAWNCCYAERLGQKPQGCQSARKPALPAPKAESRSGSQSVTTTTASSGIQQQVKTRDGRVKTGNIKARNEGKAGAANIQQTVEASGNGVIETGDLEAHVGTEDQ